MQVMNEPLAVSSCERAQLLEAARLTFSAAVGKNITSLWRFPVSGRNSSS